MDTEGSDNIEETTDNASGDVKEDPDCSTQEETVKEASDEAAEDMKEEAEEDSGEDEKEKGSRFRRKDKKEKLDKKDEKIAELTDRVTRQMAEFDNFRKRTEKEKSQMFDLGAKNVIEKILPVVDNFERGLAAVPEENRSDSFVDGMDKIYKQMMMVLEEAGVKPIEAVGKEFDPNLHNAVMHVEDEALGENEIVEEFQKGYLYHDSVVRHSMVKVAN
ncbi:MAG: nucleotide exchange factor GrpE [Lachnospiraceae bacterium]